MDLDNLDSDKFNPPWVNSFYEDNLSRLWILGNPHLLTFDREKNILLPIPNSEFEKNVHFMK